MWFMWQVDLSREGSVFLTRSRSTLRTSSTIARTVVCWKRSEQNQKKKALDRYRSLRQVHIKPPFPPTSASEPVDIVPWTCVPDRVHLAST